MPETETRRPGPAPVTAERILALVERDQRETGDCLTTIHDLAQRVEKSVRQVRGVLVELEESGRLIREYVAHPRYRGRIWVRLRLPT